jgi:transcriptional regulator with XRE-family HTH domain
MAVNTEEIASLPMVEGDEQVLLSRATFGAALKSVLEQRTWTLSAASVASGFKRHTIRRWINGRTAPYREDVERLAITLNAPSLMAHTNGIRHRRIEVVCPECGTTRTKIPNVVKALEIKNLSTLIAVNWEQGKAQQLCVTCSHRATANRLNTTLTKRKGRKGLTERAQGLVNWLNDNPDKHQSFQQAATAARWKTPPDDRAKARWRLGKLPLNLTGKIALCQLCYRVLYTKRAKVESQSHRGDRNIGLFHGPCFNTWRRSPEWAAWVSARVSAAKSGNATPPIPLPPRPARRPVTESSVLEAYETTIRYFRIQEHSSLADRSDDGKVQSLAWLAGQLGLSRQGLRQRVIRFLSTLPESECVTGTVVIWREVFLLLGSDLLAKA